MNPRRTWILVLFATGVLAFILLYEWPRLQNGPGPLPAEKLFPGLEPAAVSSLELVLRSNQVIRLERTNENWFLSLPIHYPAPKERVEGLIRKLSQSSRQAYISPQELAGLKPSEQDAFGLNPPAVSAILQCGSQRIEMRLGALSPIGDQAYYQVVGQEGIFLAPADLLSAIPRTLDAWRDPYFLWLAALKFDRIEMRANTLLYELERDPAGPAWQLVKPMAARADNPKIEALLRMLELWPVSQFVSDSTRPDLESYGLQPPEAVLVFGRDTNDLLTVQFGKSPTNEPSLVYARRSTFGTIVKVPRVGLDRLRVPFSEFRDRHLLSPALASIDRIEVRARNLLPFGLQRQTNAQWRVTPLNFAADPELVRDFLHQLSTIEVVEFVKDVVTDFSDFGLAQPGLQYVLRATAAAPGLTNGPFVQLDFGTNQQDRVFVRRADEASVYAIALQAFARLPQTDYEFRERRIWSFTSNQVQTATLAWKGQSWKLARNAARQWILPTSGQRLPEYLAVIFDEVLFRLGELKVVAWVTRGEDQLARFGFKPAERQITLEVTEGGQSRSHALDFGALASPANCYAAALLDGQRLIFEVPVSLQQLFAELPKGLAPPAATP